MSKLPYGDAERDGGREPGVAVVGRADGHAVQRRRLAIDRMTQRHHARCVVDGERRRRPVTDHRKDHRKRKLAVNIGSQAPISTPTNIATT